MGRLSRPRTGVMAYSLYGEVRKPTEEMLRDVDTLVFDVQDVGTRVYTFIYTMALAMEAAREFGKRFVVLDRPNPIGGLGIEGAILEPGHESFVGMYPIPMRHGMTVAELARMFNEEFGIGCDLDVVPMRGYRREFWFNDTDAPGSFRRPICPRPIRRRSIRGRFTWKGQRLARDGARPGLSKSTARHTPTLIRLLSI